MGWRSRKQLRTGCRSFLPWRAQSSDEPSKNDRPRKSDTAGAEYYHSGGIHVESQGLDKSFGQRGNCCRNAYVLRMRGSTKAMLLGERAQVAVERALSEFRSGR